MRFDEGLRDLEFEGQTTEPGKEQKETQAEASCSSIFSPGLHLILQQLHRSHRSDEERNLEQASKCSMTQLKMHTRASHRE